MAEWISVKDRQPVESGKYLVAYCRHAVWVMRIMWFFTEYQGYELERGRPSWVEYDSEIGDIDYTETITHWMPLPEPPDDDVRGDTNAEL